LAKWTLDILEIKRYNIKTSARQHFLGILRGSSRVQAGFTWSEGWDIFVIPGRVTLNDGVGHLPVTALLRDLALLAAKQNPIAGLSDRIGGNLHHRLGNRRL
jgi:hypothetical protein